VTRSICFLAALALAACGGNANNLTNDASGTMSGAVSGTATCGPPLAVYASQGNYSGVAFSCSIGSNGDGGPNISFSGNLAAGTWTQSNSIGSISVTQGTQSWMATSGSSPAGTWTLTITSVGGQVSSNPGATGYLVHGSIDATLPAVTSTGASGTVTAHFTM
jgi:hypothetical protein